MFAPDPDKPHIAGTLLSTAMTRDESSPTSSSPTRALLLTYRSTADAERGKPAAQSIYRLHLKDAVETDSTRSAFARVHGCAQLSS
jgi:hypothetical protein